MNNDNSALVPTHFENPLLSPYDTDPDDDTSSIEFRLTEDEDSDQDIKDSFIYDEGEVDSITNEMYAQGMDMQGMVWNDTSNTREAYRRERMKDFVNYLSVQDQDHKSLVNKIESQPVKKVSKDETFYRFKHSKTNVRCTFGHFQLRNLLCAPNKNHVYYICDDAVRQWSTHSRTSKEILNVNQADTPQSLAFTISSISCGHDMLVIGGAGGEYACRRIDDKDSKVYYGATTSNTQTGIANHIEIISTRTGVLQSIMSNNDHRIRFMNLETLKFDTVLDFKFPINCSTSSPDKRLLCVVGDSTESCIVDISSGRVVMEMNEHHDYSFACAWHPDGRTVATGNQDKTTRIYDIRKSTEAIHVLGGMIGSIRSLHYSHDGKYLAAAEHIDFVHIYDTSTFETSQVVDMFGDIAGIGFTPEDNSIYIANAHEQHGGIFEFEKLQDTYSPYL
ncbi:hypothetical protein J3Q64DRAFT_1714960 [Phycomyces blakesleeanus]|uniref:Uncharacterized protein n=2 Tax=Phycomyces blakesleeanus TaxID=4837 RepID=A0A167QEC2_PHYB8|nr:hypothetical protein PHYBLDRAFT_184820 [Phycomyces blakesleeanus NRRL 1555(-)]OAD79578.1 hypothetical protein PHYBLDRAFT_184820 [Phycomyces blakesleeanus NRRL 1555(-)]|eukprot:XP_018297618.1 hypothetical protein PHYBLDRAFT_184820 [Phycomyces blakesleeanus NRRL 1555(-)]